MKKTWQDLVGTRLPILQAPMTGAQDTAVVVAVSHAGGLAALLSDEPDPERARRSTQAP